MSKLRSCPVCGKDFLNGFKALVKWQGHLTHRTVCRRCASKAERICITDKSLPCIVPSCASVAHVCSEHYRLDVERAHASAVADAVKQLTALYVGIKVTERNSELDASDFIDGKLEGLESAIRILKGKTP